MPRARILNMWLCSHICPMFRRAPFDLMSCHHLEILNVFWTRICECSFVTGPRESHVLCWTYPSTTGFSTSIWGRNYSPNIIIVRMSKVTFRMFSWAQGMFSINNRQSYFLLYSIFRGKWNSASLERPIRFRILFSLPLNTPICFQTWIVQMLLHKTVFNKSCLWLVLKQGIEWHLFCVYSWCWTSYSHNFWYSFWEFQEDLEFQTRPYE